MVKQINLGVWPSGDSKPLMTVAIPIEALSSRLGLQLQRGVDDLDEYSFAVIALADGSPAMIHRYDQEPFEGTLVYIDRLADTADALKAVRATLELEQSDKVVWEQTMI